MSATATSFPARLREIVASKPGAPAITFGEETLTWAALDARTNRMARALLAAGAKAGDLLTIGLPNSLGFIEACWAAWKIGATPQPISARLPEPEIRAIVDLAKSPLLIGDAAMPAVRPRFSADDLLRRSDDARPLPDAVSPTWKAPTSGGSTGRPKLILSGAPAIYTPEAADIWRLTGEDTCVMPGPMYHNGPFSTVFLGLLRGAHIVLLGRFDAEATLAAIARHRATWIYVVPTMMNRIWKLPPEIRTRYDLSSLKTLWHLAAPCPPWLKEAFIEWLGADVVWELYAGTEAQAATVISGAEWMTHKGTVGKVAGTGQMKILDTEGREVPVGTVGEIFMKRGEGTPATYKYLGAEARRIGEWESLGDMGHFDAEGYLYLSDRRADMILVGGANVYPAEVEAAIEAHPLVQSSAVIGLPDDDLGSRIHAIVQTKGALSEADLLAHLRARLVVYKCPRTIEFVDYPLRDDAGKVRRSDLRAARLKAS